MFRAAIEPCGKNIFLKENQMKRLDNRLTNRPSLVIGGYEKFKSLG
jgi:hypothetical protein